MEIGDQRIRLESEIEAIFFTDENIQTHGIRNYFKLAALGRPDAGGSTARPFDKIHWYRFLLRHKRIGVRLCALLFPGRLTFNQGRQAA